MNQRITIASLAAGLLLAGGTPAIAGVVFTVEETTNGTTSTSQLRAQGGMLALKMSGAEQEGEMIYNAAKQEMVAIAHAQKMYMVFDQATLDSFAQRMKELQAQMANLPEAVRQQMMQRMPGMAGGEPPPPPEVRRSNSIEEMHGYKCRKVELVRDGRVTREFWVTDWDNVAGGKEAAEAFTSLAEFVANMVASMGEMGTRMADEGLVAWKSLDGFPVVTRELDEQGQVKSESVLKSSQEQDLDEASFQPPADYRQQSLAF